MSEIHTTLYLLKKKKPRHNRTAKVLQVPLQGKNIALTFPQIVENFNITKKVQEANNGNYEIRLFGLCTHILSVDFL